MGGVSFAKIYPGVIPITFICFHRHCYNEHDGSTRERAA